MVILRLWLLTCISVVLYSTGSATEPRDYATYDLMGMVHFEDIKDPSSLVKRAIAEEQTGKCKEAEILYKRQLSVDLNDLQAIVGYAKSVRRQGPTYTKSVVYLVLKDPKFKYSDYAGRTPNQVNALSVMLLKGLLYLSERNPYKSWAYGSFAGVYRRSQENFVAALYLWSFGAMTPTEERTMFEALHKKYPKVEGFDYYRILAYINGNYGSVMLDPKTKKFINVGSKNDRPQCETACQELQPYLMKTHAPTWVYFLASSAYSGTGRKDLAAKYARLVKAAKGDSKLLRDWKSRIDKSGLLK